MPANDDEALIARWLEHDKTPATRVAYGKDVRSFLRFARRPLREIQPADLERFQAAIARAGGAPATVRRKLRAVKSLLAFGHAAGDLPRHAGLPVILPAGAALEHPVPTRAEVERLLRLTEAPAELRLLQTLYVAGLRASEAAETRRSSLRQMEGRPAIVIFGPRPRVVLIPAALYAGLLEVAERPDSLFGLSARQVARVVKRRAIAAGLPASFTAERLRSAHRAHALERGAPVAVICATLGDRLPIAAPEMLRDAAHESSAMYLL